MTSAAMVIHWSLMHGRLVDARFFEPNIGPLAERFHALPRGPLPTKSPTTTYDSRQDPDDPE
jgi:hypothetical protein